MTDHLTIGGAAKSLGLNPRTLRFYDRIGLLTPSARHENGYRLYSPRDLERLKFIVRAKALSLSLEEIRSILSLTDERLCSSARQSVGEMLARKIEEIDDRIRQMRDLRKELVRSREQVGESREVPCPADSPCGCLE